MVHSGGFQNGPLAYHFLSELVDDCHSLPCLPCCVRWMSIYLADCIRWRGTGNR